MASRTRFGLCALILLGALLIAPSCALALEANSGCVGCHQAMSPGQASFDMPMPDKDVVCRKCHLPIFAGTHPIHNPGSNCGACHFNFGASLPNRVPTVILSAGAFASVVSTELPAEVIHTIHAAARWPAGVETADSKCGSCHNVAACSACHGDIVHSTHSQHGASDPSTTSIGASWTGNLSPGVIFGTAEYTVLENQTLRCGAPGCHDTDGVAASVPDLMDCYSHPAYPELHYVATTVTKTGSWSWLAGGAYTLRRETFSNYSTSALNTTFNGHKVSIISTTDPYRGIGRVFIDNIDMGTLDEFSETTLFQRNVWTSPELEPGTHSLQVVVTGTKNPLARGTWVGYDNIEISRISPDGIAPDCGTCHGADHATNGSFCGTCHPGPQGTYAGPSVFSASVHGATATSTVARTQYPGTSYGPDSCANCHVNHTATRSAGNQICYDCHDATGTQKSLSYSYQEAPKYASSAHGSSVGAQSCGACHAVHGASNGSGGVVGAALKSSEPRVCTGYQSTPGCHAIAGNSRYGTNVLAAFEANAASSTHHDAFSSAVGHINCSSCHNPHLDTPTTQTADPSAIGRSLARATERFRDADGNVYALVGAQHDGIGPTVTSSNLMYYNASTPTLRNGYWYSNEPATSVLEYGPTTSYGNQLAVRNTITTYHSFANLSLAVGTTWHYRIKMTDQLGNVSYTSDATARTPWTYLTKAPVVTGGANMSSVVVTWTTLGECESWVDYGQTTSYGSVAGNATNATYHSVTLPALTAGTWQLRARSQRDGDLYTSGNMSVGVFPAYATPPVLTPIGSNTSIPGPLVITFNWSQPNVTYAPFTYQLHVWDPYNPYEYASGWLTSTSASLTLDGDHNYFWTVAAKDKDGLVYPLQSPPGSFTLTYYQDSGSCPFFFTWDGDSYEFESDMMMSGKLGNKISTGYQMPNPQDAYGLRHQPAEVDGRWKFRMVEERFEVDYIDHLQLFAADAPAGYTVYAEKPGVGGKLKEVAAQLHTVRDPVAPPSAFRTDTGQDVSVALAFDDDVYVVLNEDRNDFTYKTIELDLGDVKAASQVKLLIDGVSAFFNSPEGTALSATYGARTKVEVQKADGSWCQVPSTELFMPVPPEFARTYVFDITKALAYGGPKVRLTFLYKTYIDMIKIDTSTDQPITLTEAPLLKAELRHHGIDPKKPIFEDVFEHLYGQPNELGSFFPGDYTAYRDVVPLLTGRDDMFTIMGGGDELDIEFGALRSPAPGVERQLIFGSYGYYKDKKTDLASTVDPLPFSAMTSYPYPDNEHYPDDPGHTAYLAEWNTRYEAGGPAPQTVVANANSSDSGVFASVLKIARHLIAKVVRSVRAAFASPGLRVASADPQVWEDTTYSVDTDGISLGIQYSGSTSSYSPQAGWFSASLVTAQPTPSSPGSPATATQLSQGASINSVYWRTDEATANGAYNWQLFRFNVPSAALPGAMGLKVDWRGHGEPSPGYPVKLYLWDFIQSKWVLASEGYGGTDFALSHVERSVGLEAFCMVCHRADPPAGSAAAAGFVNIASIWDSDRHGSGSGSGLGGTLIAPYVRGNTSISCGVCHDSHGSANIYHIESQINSTSGISVTNGVQFQNACRACHSGAVADLHDQCRACHLGDGGFHWSAPYPTATSDCASCHKHGYVYYHPERGCHGCGDPGGLAWRAF